MQVFLDFAMLRPVVHTLGSGSLLVGLRLTLMAFALLSRVSYRDDWLLSQMMLSQQPLCTRWLGPVLCV